MIDKVFGGFILICDNCNESCSEVFETFQDAVDSKEENSFITKKYGNEYKDLCGECQ